MLCNIARRPRQEHIDLPGKGSPLLSAAILTVCVSDHCTSHLLCTATQSEAAGTTEDTTQAESTAVCSQRDQGAGRLTTTVVFPRGERAQASQPPLLHRQVMRIATHVFEMAARQHDFRPTQHRRNCGQSQDPAASDQQFTCHAAPVGCIPDCRLQAATGCYGSPVTAECHRLQNTV